MALTTPESPRPPESTLRSPLHVAGAATSRVEGKRRLLASSLALGAAGTWAVASHLLPPGLPLGVGAVLGVLASTLALTAVVHRWVLPGLLSQLATSSRGARVLWLLGCTAIAWLLLRAIPVNAPKPHVFGTLTLTATGARNPQAVGTELWIFELRRPDGGTSSPDEWERTGAWELRDGAWLSYQQQPATIRWQGWAPSPLKLELLSHTHSGIVRYEWNGQSREVDLYSPQAKRLQLELPLSGGATLLGHRVQRVLFHVTHVATVAALLLTAGLWLTRRAGPRPIEERPTLREGLLYALPSLVTVGIWWLAVFPGLMSSDSTDQWHQAVTGRMHDAHPVLNTFLIRMLIKLWPTPGIVTGVQILTFGALVGWGCVSLRQAGLSRPVVWVTAIVLGLAPVNGTLVNTIWKDVPFSLSVLALSILLFRRIHLRYEPRWSFWVGLGVATFMTLLTRHNGPPAAMAAFLGLLLLEPRHWKALAMTLVVTLAVAAGAKKLILRTYNADVPDNGLALIGYLGAHVAAGTQMTEDERAILDDIHPLDDQWNYSCVTNVPTVFDGRFDYGAVRRHQPKLPGLLASLTQRDYRPTVNHFACATTILWRLSQGAGHNNGPPVMQRPSGALGTIYESPISPQPAPVLPELGQTLLSSVVRTLQSDLSWLFWRPALPLCLMMLACAIACLRRLSWHPMVLLLPLLLHTLVLALVIPSPDIRYQYPVFLVSQMFTLAWLLIPRREETTPGS